MKKLLLAEFAVLVILMVAALFTSVSMIEPMFSPILLQTPEDTAPSTDVQETPEETTAFIPTWKTYPEDRALLAQQYFVYDCQADTFLTISGAKTERIYPASVTKLFTAYVAMQYLQPGTQITAGDELNLVAWGSSVAKIKKGDTLTAMQLVEAMLLPSGNDAAYVLACEAGRVMKNDPNLSASSAVAAFVGKMNALAKELGMTDTHFANPDGIHEDSHYTTFADLAVLGELSMTNATVMQYAATARDEVQLHGETVEWKNTNAIIDPASPYYCPYAVGLKTGQTPVAGSCLLSAFVYEDYQLIIGVFGCPEEEDRFDDTLQLFNETVLK